MNPQAFFHYVKKHIGFTVIGFLDEARTDEAYKNLVSDKKLLVYLASLIRLALVDSIALTKCLKSLVGALSLFIDTCIVLVRLNKGLQLI